MIFGGKTGMKGQPVHINCGPQSAEFRRDRATGRVTNLTAKLARLQFRKSEKNMSQEIANTEEAINRWSKVLRVAEFELKLDAEGVD